jgi:hypothetical protein
MTSSDWQPRKTANVCLSSIWVHRNPCGGNAVLVTNGWPAHPRLKQALGAQFAPTTSQVYFVAYGQIGRAVNFQQIWTPELQLFSTPLGDFSLIDAMLASPLLRLHSWLFVPTPQGWVPPKCVNPRFLSQDVTDDLGGAPGIVISPTNFTWRSVDEKVEFERSSLLGFDFWKITRLTVPAVDSPQRILRMFKHKVEHCRRIECHDHPTGVTVNG